MKKRFSRILLGRLQKSRRDILLDLIRRMPPPDLLASAPVSQLLLDRLSREDLDDISRSGSAEELEVLRQAKPQDQIWVQLAIGLKYLAATVQQKTGLLANMPPDDVHAMSRSWLGTGGSYGHADLVLDALASAGVTMETGMAGLDFGCSSARVVRVLAAAFPKLKWYGCDPNEGAISWSKQNLSRIEFQVSPLRPPLDFPPASLDFVFAISIWSHFNENAALEWFEELHRIIKPSGHLIFTTHGWASVAYYLQTQERSEEQLFEIVGELLSYGYWYLAEFGENGDHGVIDSGWGTAFLTPGWVAANLCPAWHIVRFCPGREGGNQDLYILRRS